MSIYAHLESAAQDAERRNGLHRRRLHLQTDGATASGAVLNVTVINLSEVGLLLQTDAGLSVGEDIEVELPLVGPQTAIVVWCSDDLYGCKFETPIGKAAVSAAQLLGLPGSDPAKGSAAEDRGSFGARLRRLRREREITLVGLAKALGVSKPTIWYWENGQVRPRPKSLAALAALFGVPLEELVPPGWTADLPAPSAEPHQQVPALNALVDSCRQKIAEAAGISPDKVDISLHL